MPKRRRNSSRISYLENKVRRLSASLCHVCDQLDAVVDRAELRMFETASTLDNDPRLCLRDFATDVAILCAALARRTTANEREITVFRRRVGELTSGMRSSVPQASSDPSYRDAPLALLDGEGSVSDVGGLSIILVPDDADESSEV